MRDKFAKQCIHISPWLLCITHFICFERCGSSKMMQWLVPLGPSVRTFLKSISNSFLCRCISVSGVIIILPFVCKCVSFRVHILPNYWWTKIAFICRRPYPCYSDHFLSVFALNCANEIIEMFASTSWPAKFRSFWMPFSVNWMSCFELSYSVSLAICRVDDEAFVDRRKNAFRTTISICVSSVHARLLSDVTPE